MRIKILNSEKKVNAGFEERPNCCYFARGQ